MNDLTFITISALYVCCLAIIDGVFNRLVFRSNKKLPYEHIAKQKIYLLPEWRYIGVILLVVLPVFFPAAAAYAIGGWQKVLTYLIVLLLVQWDMIFGKIVFNDWWGDKPSIALPFIGWTSFSLRLIIISRIMLAIIIGLLLI